MGALENSTKQSNRFGHGAAGQETESNRKSKGGECDGTSSDIGDDDAAAAAAAGADAVAADAVSSSEGNSYGDGSNGVPSKIKESSTNPLVVVANCCRPQQQQQQHAFSSGDPLWDLMNLTTISFEESSAIRWKNNRLSLRLRMKIREKGRREGGEGERGGLLE
ncbi:hypothetical protein M0804_000804 [Polistes exclamans]|nr:hypothetical protein M0804_000804 [Polistes exclamans]